MSFKFNFTLFVLGFANFFIESGVSTFIEDFIRHNGQTDFILIGGRRTEIAQTRQGLSSFIPTFNSSYFSSVNFEHPIVFIANPINISHASTILQEINRFYSIISENQFKVWKPLFFIIWPNPRFPENKIGLKNISDAFLTQFQSQPYFSILLDSDLFVVFEYTSTNNSNLTIMEVYYLNKDSNLTFQDVNLTINKTVVVTNYFSKAIRRQNFNRANIIAVGLADPDYEYQCKLDESNGTVRFISGIAVDILHALQFSLNFSYTALKGEGWIEQFENGTWAGMARQIRAGEADLGISQSTFIYYRILGLGFLHPTSFGYVKAFFSQPPASSIRDIFITPFNADLWICLLISWVLLISCILSFHWIRLNYTDFEVGSHVHINDAELVNACLLWTIGTLCQQGWHGCPSSSSLKIILLFGSVLGLVYYVAFSAALVSTLSVDILPIRTIDDLAQSNLEIWGDIWLPNNQMLVDSILLRRKKIIKFTEEQFMEIDNAMPKLVEKPSAYVTFSEGFLTVFNRLKYSDRFYCKTFSALPVMKAPHKSGMIVKKNSPYTEIFNHKILMMRESGLITRFNQHYAWGTVAMCPKTTHSQYRDKLGIYDVFTAYFIVFGGYSISCLCLLIECFTFMTGITKISGKIINYFFSNLI